MPRINRDLERRMAARRERARQRTPRERRYDFTTGAAEQGADGPVAAAQQTRDQAAVQVPLRGIQARSAPRPFSDYRLEYAYVLQDLRRIVLVVGLLVLLLLALWFILPR